MTTPHDYPDVVPENARPFQGRRAGIITRGVAAFLDGLVVIGIVAVIYGVIIATTFLIHPARFHWPTYLGWGIPVILFVVAAPYLALAWSTTGRTWGSAVMGVRVVTGQGRRLRLPRAALRAFLCVIFPIGLLWIAVNPANRSVQDLLVGTSVIYDWTPWTDRT